MAKTTIQEFRQQLTHISITLACRADDSSLSSHDRNAIKHAEQAIDTARAALFACESQS